MSRTILERSVDRLMSETANLRQQLRQTGTVSKGQLESRLKSYGKALRFLVAIKGRPR
jgi:hypothetical protein